MSKTFDKASGIVEPPESQRLAALMVKYGPALQRYFARKAGPEVADDLVQDVFLRLQISAEHGSLEDAERYIFTVAKRALIDRRRAEARRDAKLHDPFDDTLDELLDDISPERILTAKQEYRRALLVILNLPPRMRTAIVLHRFGRLSFSAIAKRMGIKKTTVQGMIEDALKKIARDMEDPS